MEQLDDNLLYRWFVGLAPDDAVWDATTFTKNRERLQQGDVFNRFMETLLHHQAVTPLLSDEHFSVDGPLIEAWAGHKSFKPKDKKDGDGEHVHGTTRMKARPIPTAASIASVRGRRANSATWDTPRWKTGTAWPSSCSRNAHARKVLVRRAQSRIDQPALRRDRQASLEGA
jgi:hypothetical protein